MCRASRSLPGTASSSASKPTIPCSITTRPSSSWKRSGPERCLKLRINFKTGAVVLLLAATVACRQDMQDQPKYIPLRPTDFFGDQRSGRQLIEGTVARGHLNDDTAFYTGKGPDGKFVNEFPFPVTKD